MATTARLDLSVWRNDDVYEYPLQIRGLDLSALALRMQVRLAPDTPGPALIDLAKVTNGNAEGLRVAGVQLVDGLPISDLRIRINKSTLQGLPYSGELGASTPLAYALQIAGKTRSVGWLSLLAHTIDSDSAPTSRSLGWSRETMVSLPGGGASLTIAGIDTTVMTVDGADLVAPLVGDARAAADAASAFAGQSGSSAAGAQTAAERASLSAAAAQAVGPYPTQAAGLAATAEGGSFLVQGAGNTYATLYRKVNGAAVAQNLSIASLAGVQDSSELAAYIADARPVLRRAFSGQRHPLATQLRALATQVVLAAGANTTDGKNVRVWRPGGIYQQVWIRDMSMAIAAMPELFDAGEVLGAYKWYKANVTAAYQVPDHISLDGTVFMKPGGNDADPGSGTRAPVDGNFFLLQMAWMHFVKTGSTTTYASDRDFLLALLEQGVPYDPATGCVYVDPNNRFFQWGFQDTVIATGNVAFASVLAFQAFRQLADMAYAAGDYATARRCVDRAKLIRNGVNSALWVQDASGGVGSAGWYRCADYFSKQPDVWATALAVYTGLATNERARGISVNFAFAWGALTGGKFELYYRGGVRHGLRSRDFEAGKRVFEGSLVVAGLSEFEKYQNGAAWNTATAWATYVIGITAPDIAAKLAIQAFGQASYEGWAYQGRTDGGVTNPAPAEWVSLLTSDIGGGVQRPILGAVNYLTSAAALMAIRADDCGPLVGAQSILTVSQTTGGQTIPNTTWTRMQYDTVAIDELLATDPSRFGVVAPFTGQYLIEFIRYVGGIGVPVQALSAVNINGLREQIVAAGAMAATDFTIMASRTIGVTKGVLIAADARINGPGGTGPFPARYVAQQPGDANTYGYNALKVTYLGNTGA